MQVDAVAASRDGRRGGAAGRTAGRLEPVLLYCRLKRRCRRRRGVASMVEGARYFLTGQPFVLSDGQICIYVYV